MRLVSLFVSTLVIAACGSAVAGSNGVSNASGRNVANADASGAPTASVVAAPIAGAAAVPPPLAESVTLHVAGDSTAAIFPETDGRVGWASVLGRFFASGVSVNDQARSGRSTKSYIDEGSWRALKAQLKAGDYLFIEFGHNDAKSQDPARYTDPATTFRANLKLFIDGARESGAYPVLMTPISRRQFDGATVVPTHGAYPAAVFAVGQAERVPVIDMETKTRVWLSGLGVADSLPMFAVNDNTHLSALGAPEVAKLAIAGIREHSLPLTARLLP